MSQQDEPTPEQPNAPGGPDDHNKDMPNDTPNDGVDRDEGDGGRSGERRRDQSDPGGDSDPSPGSDY